jgi:cohesin loading factor subunit SCC2
MVARSGFIHPLSLAPTLVALTASTDSQVASKANSTLTILHQKHASLLVTRFIEPARASHNYAKANAAPALPRGYRGDPPDSCFGRWFR